MSSLILAQKGYTILPQNMHPTMRGGVHHSTVMYTTHALLLFGFEVLCLSNCNRVSMFLLSRLDNVYHHT